MLDLQPGQQVLDVGCGIGGSAFLMAQVRRNRNYKLRTLTMKKKKKLKQVESIF